VKANFSEQRFQVSFLLKNKCTAQRCRSETNKNISEDLFSSVLSQCKKYHSSGNPNFNNLSIFQGMKLRILMEKIRLISLKLNFTPNTLGCHGLILLQTSKWSHGHSKQWRILEEYQ